MGTEINLRPVRSEKEARALGSVGGKASGEARRRKRDIRERLQALLDAKVNGVEGADALALALFEKALSGDVKAYELLVASVGQSPRQTLKPIDLPPVERQEDMPRFVAAVLQAVSRGELGIDEADKITRIASLIRKPAGLAIPVGEASENISSLGIIRPLTPREAMAELVRRSRRLDGDSEEDDNDDPLDRLVAEARQG